MTNNKDVKDSTVVDDIKDVQVDERPINQKSRKYDSWHVGKMFWGLLLVLIGGLMLADNFNIISVSWDDLWRLWPLAIVAAGLSVLSFRNLVWHVIAVAFATLMLGIVVWVAVGGYAGSHTTTVRDVTIQKTSNAVKQAEINVKTGAGKLQIGTTNQTAIAVAKFESNGANLTSQSMISGDTQQVTLSTYDNDHWWTSGSKNALNVSLTRNLPLSLNVDVGASDTEIDMSNAKLRAINVKAGACSIKLKLGNLENAVSVDINSGVSSIVLQVPKASGISLKLESGLTTKNLADLSEVSQNSYESAGYSQSSNKININSKIGVSSFTIERY